MEESEERWGWGKAKVPQACVTLHVHLYDTRMWPGMAKWRRCAAQSSAGIGHWHRPGIIDIIIGVFDPRL